MLWPLYNYCILSLTTAIDFTEFSDADVGDGQFSTDYYTGVDFVEKFTEENRGDTSILHINSRSLCKNFDSITDFLFSLEHDFSFIAITESWISETTNCSLLNIDGYTFLHNDRIGRRGGGVGIYVKNDINVKIRNDLSSLFKDKTETLFIEVVRESRNNTIIGVVYKPPDGDFHSFHQNLSNCLEVISVENKISFIAGDFNVDLLNSSPSSSAEAFLNTLRSYAFYPTIDKSTRTSETSSTLIDNIFTNCYSVYVRSGILISEISDHYPIFVFCNLHIKRNYPKGVTYINNTCYKNMARLRYELSLIDWTIVTDDRDADSAYSKFSEIIQNAYKRCCPLTKLNHKINTSKSPWLTTGILKSIRKKNVLFARFKRSFSTAHKAAYTRYRNILTSVIKNAKKMYYANLISLNSNDGGKIWNILNNVIGRKKSDEFNSTFVCNDVVINDNYAVCNGFNEYFASVAQNLSDNLPLSHVNPLKGLDFNSESFVIFPTDSDEVLSSINDLKGSKSPGFDGISSNVLKRIGDVVASPISHIINLSFLNGVFPSELKIAKVIPIFKSGDKQQFSNYRPVSLLPSVSKIFERLMYNRISSFIHKHNILTSFQYGFRKGYSTDMAAVNLVDKVTSALDNKLSAIGIFIDLSKAFDTIDHNILLNKLFAYGFRGVTHSWIKSYLENRVQYVHYNGMSSYRLSCNVGVPQGSILGPLLFLLYINNIHSASEVPDFILFADDTTILFQDKNLGDAILKAEKEFNKLLHWLNANKLSLNIKKTKVLIFDNKKQHNEPDVYINLGGTFIKPSSYTKFLGILIDNKLNWKEHISYITKTIARVNGIIYKTKNFLPKSVLILIYNALVLPHLNYSLLLWGNAHKTFLNNLHILQKKIIRNIHSVPYNTHSAPLFTNSNILNIFDLYSYQVGIFMYKFHHGLLPESFDSFFAYNYEFHNYNTRSKTSIHVDYSRTKLNQLQIRSRGVFLWNSLPSNIKDSKSLHLFKTSLKRYIQSSSIEFS